MKTSDKLWLIGMFMFGAVGFWLLTGYQLELEPERLRRMVVLRAGFSMVVGCVFCLGRCIYKIMEE